MKRGDFYEDDEPVEELLAKFGPGDDPTEEELAWELPGVLHTLDEVATEFGVDLEDESCPRCGGDHAWCQWVQPGEFGEEAIRAERGQWRAERRERVAYALARHQDNDCFDRPREGIRDDRPMYRAMADAAIAAMEGL